MAAIEYCSTFSNENLANHFYAIARSIASESSITRNGDEFVVCLRVRVGGCDIGMLRNLAVRTCEGTFCSL